MHTVQTEAATLPTREGVGGARSRWRAWLIGAVLVGLAARIPGVFWGANFPGGWYGHHPDEYTHLVNAEMLIDPSSPPRWRPHPYPKAMAGMVAAPILLARAARGELGAPPPSVRTIITAGRLVSALYGVATIVVVFLLARQLFRDRRVALAAAWFMALGGLHVTQSHFFLSDAPAIFWLFLGLYLLAVDLARRDRGSAEYLRWGAFAFGAAFGMKLFVTGLPTLGLVALLRGPRVMRVAHAAVFFAIGFLGINLASFTPYELLDALVRGVGDPYVFSRSISTLLYVAELPSVVGLPTLVLGVAGAGLLAARWIRLPGRRFLAIGLVVVLPLAVHAFLVIAKLDHFPRHLVTFIPWIALTAGWALVAAADRLAARGVPRAALVAPVFLYLAAFVLDGERVFIRDPRNDAARWLATNVPAGTTIWWKRHGSMPGYVHQRFPEKGRAPVLVIEMLDANHYLSGIGPKNSYPSDHRNVFDSISQERHEQMQALFRGTAEYRAVARFDEGYFMPEYVLANRWLGDRSRNYVTEVVIFARDPALADAGGAAPVSLETEGR